MLSVNEYAKEKGISRQAVMKQIARGQLIGKKEGGKWYMVQPTATKLQPTATKPQPLEDEDENLYTGVWVAINSLTKRTEMLEQKVAQLEKARTMSGRGARDTLSNKEHFMAVKGAKRDLFKEARDKGITVSQLLKVKK